jgi:hypothetical protein
MVSQQELLIFQPPLGANQVPTVGLQVITSEKDRHLIVLGADPICWKR